MNLEKIISLAVLGIAVWIGFSKRRPISNPLSDKEIKKIEREAYFLTREKPPKSKKKKSIMTLAKQRKSLKTFVYSKDGVRVPVIIKRLNPSGPS